MKQYFFRAKSLDNKEKKGYLRAKDEFHLSEILRKEGFFLVEFKEKDKEKVEREFRSISLFSPSLKEKLIFTRNLQLMISAGISLSESLDALSLQIKNEKFKKAILDIRERVIKGENFSEALSFHQDIFSHFFQNMIKVGEETGNLEEVLKILSEQMEKEKTLKSHLTGALIYPAVVFLTLVSVFILMMVFVVPKLALTFEELGVELPKSTRFLISLGNFFTKNWLFFILLFLLSILSFPLISRREIFKKIFDKILLKLPLISSIVIQTNLSFASYNLSSLLRSGVNFPRALEVTAKTLDNFYFRQSLIEAAKEVKKGLKISEILQRFSHIYPPSFIQMLKTGEETGKMTTILLKSANFYEEEVAYITRNLSSIIEPIMILLVGVAIGFFALSMIQPIYSIMSQIK
jgi:type II secretory pathway component PulF